MLDQPANPRYISIYRKMPANEPRAWPVRQTWAAFTTLYSIGEAVIATDAQGRVELLNPAAEVLTGWKDEEARGQPLDAMLCMVNQETHERLENPGARVVRDGQIARLPEHAVLLARDGTPHPIAGSGAPVRDDHGTIVGVVLVCRDQTGERAGQRMLRDSQRMLSNVLDTIPVRVFWKDLDGRYLGCNTPFARDSGFSVPGDLIGRDDFQMGWKKEAERYRADDRQIVETGVPKLGYEEPQTTPDGGCLWLRTSKIPLRDVGGRTIGILGTYEDITPRKQAEAALRESEARFRSLFENNFTVMFVIDPDSGAIVNANPAATAYYGWPRAELITKNIAALNTLSPEQIQAEMEVARETRRGHFEFKHRRADGSIRDVEVFSSPVSVAGRNPALLTRVRCDRPPAGRGAHLAAQPHAGRAERHQPGHRARTRPARTVSGSLPHRGGKGRFPHGVDRHAGFGDGPGESRGPCRRCP